MLGLFLIWFCLYGTRANCCICCLLSITCQHTHTHTYTHTHTHTHTHSRPWPCVVLARLCVCVCVATSSWIILDPMRSISAHGSKWLDRPNRAAPTSHFITTSWSGSAHTPSPAPLSHVATRSGPILTESNWGEICLIDSPQIFGEAAENQRQFSPGGEGDVLLVDSSSRPAGNISVEGGQKWQREIALPLALHSKCVSSLSRHRREERPQTNNWNSAPLHTSHTQNSSVNMKWHSWVDAI